MRFEIYFLTSKKSQYLLKLITEFANEVHVNILAMLKVLYVVGVEITLYCLRIVKFTEIKNENHLSSSFVSRSTRRLICKQFLQSRTQDAVVAHSAFSIRDSV